MDEVKNVSEEKQECVNQVITPEIDQTENAQKLQIALEKLEAMKDAEEIKVVEETKKTEEIKAVEETKEIEEIKAVEESKETEKVKEVEESEETEEIKAVEETAAAEETKEVEETKAVEEPEKTEDSMETEERKMPSISLPEPTSGYVNDISVFCITQQGESHIKNEIPCQDRSEFRWVNDKILIAAIADGVGSCPLSDYGAETAVKSSLDFLEQYFQTAMKKSDFIFDVPAQMKAALSGAMQYAYDSVEKRAEELEVSQYTMQSTLTITIYDGTTIYFGHAGDDGVVALNKDGIYAMVTSRVKGEEASSVYPLQSKRWFYGKVNDTVAFVMATDGVLDAFVRPLAENNRVYYPFVEPVFYTSQTDPESAKLNCQDWNEYLSSPAYRKAVTDDITFVGIVNQAAIKTSNKPVFDDKEWNRQSEEYRRRRMAVLYPDQKSRVSEQKEKSDKKPETEKKVYCSQGSSSRNSKDISSKKFGSRNNNEGLKRKTEYTDSREVIRDGARQAWTGITRMSAGFGAIIIEAGEGVLSATSEWTEQAAEAIKQRQKEKNQQKTNSNVESKCQRKADSDAGPESTSTDSNK